ncbi:ABC transporter ATP-binding protein [Bifidobacterium mongoliense]|uniref:ABC transporter ATP-binding protein n=1 Tax=Bifidobacterium mongoliense TaxID=518643 RepID=UPI002A764A3F|nr:ABC transporter ATP-binding protein [Bifidobacterium mongoliense]MDY3125314.1 ABC transporter ATP-binding protein [Bifidobacterium mongoliense]
MSVDISRLRVDIGRTAVVDDVTMHIGAGERVGLVGTSGSGKSMIARAMLGLLPLDARASGHIRYGDDDTWADGSDGSGLGVDALACGEETMADLRGRYVSTVFQDPATTLSPVLTALQQVTLPLRRHYRMTRGEYAERGMAALQRVGLDPMLADHLPHQLSGGQRQRVAIATAIVTSPKLLIADEPTTALDAIAQREIVDLLVGLVDESGAAMLFITHDFSILARATRRCYVMRSGRMVEAGDTSSLLGAPQREYTRHLVDAAERLTLHGAGAAGPGADRADDVGNTRNEGADDARN